MSVDEVNEEHGTKPEDAAFYAVDTLDALVSILLEQAMAATGADRGNVQLFDPEVAGLRIAAHRGFDDEFLDYFAVVTDVGSACGRAAERLEQTVIEDVDKDPGFAPHREIARSSGFRAVQSTPLVSPQGVLVGMVSTHFVARHRPDDESLRTLAIYGRSFGAILSGLQSARLDVSQRLALKRDELRTRVGQLEQALDSRIVIEQAKGMAAYAWGVTPDEAFLRLRRHSRGNGTGLRALCEEIVANRRLPAV